MSLVWALVFFGVTAPFAVLCGAFDLTRMKIPNWVVLGLFACFLLLGPFAFDLSEFGLRLAQSAVVLVLGFLLNAYLGIGGGDGKFAAAAAAYIAPAETGQAVLMLAVLSLIAVFSHRQLGRIRALKDVTRTWASYSAGDKFPFGLALAATVICYHMLQVFRAL